MRAVALTMRLVAVLSAFRALPDRPFRIRLATINDVNRASKRKRKREKKNTTENENRGVAVLRKEEEEEEKESFFQQTANE